MLPGFRFLFAAIVLSMSILVFGLGAAALLRAAHEEFASTPSWRVAPEPKFAQRNQTPDEPPVPVLAMLRVEPEPARAAAAGQCSAGRSRAGDRPGAGSAREHRRAEAAGRDPAGSREIRNPAVRKRPCQARRTAEHSPPPPRKPG